MASSFAPKPPASSLTATIATPVVTPGIVLQPSSGTVLTVGAGMEFATLGDALKASQDGDTIAVKAGTYTNDFGTVTTSVRIVAVGGIVNEVATVPPPNDKGLITVDNNLSIQGFTFTGGSDGGPDGNVSGIRLETGNLAVSYCYFHDMQEGLLAGANPTGTISIDHSEFARNGTGDGQSHNLYVGAIASLSITNSYFHDAYVGHEIKSRAAVTTITNNVIADGPNGTASYDIDLPNAGAATITGNVIEKGPNASNDYAIHYGGELQFVWASNSLLVSNNTILNDMAPTVGALVANQSALNGISVSASITGNRLYGFDADRLAIGSATLSGNTTLTTEPAYSTASPWQSAPPVSLAAGPETLNLVNGNHLVNGGIARLNLNDTFGSNTIAGGAGGLGATVSGWDNVSTAAGASDTITLLGRSNVLQSAGNDRITAAGLYQQVRTTGAATITGSGFNSYDLEGAGETLTLNGASQVNVGATGNARIFDNSGDIKLSASAGAKLTLSDQAGLAHGAPASSATVAGACSGWIGDAGAIVLTTGDAGAAVQAGAGLVSVTGGAGPDVLTAGSGTDIFVLGGGADQVTFGTGRASVTGGSGAESYHFHHGSPGNDTISGFKQGKDSLHFDGFTGNAVSGAAVSNGSSVLTLTDGTVITFAGTVLAAYSPSPAPGAGGATGPAPVSPPTSPGSGGTPASGTVLNSGGHVVTGGTTLLTLTDAAGGNTIAGGAGGLAANVAGGDVLTTAPGSTNHVTLSRYDTLTGAGTDQVVAADTGNVIVEAGAATVSLQSANNAVQGGAGLLQLTDSVGGDSVTGGAGGLQAALAGSYDVVRTQAGSANAVSLSGRSSLLSQGTDTIALQGLYNQVTQTGAATITGGGVASFDLEGAAVLATSGSGTALVGAHASASIMSADAGDLAITKLAGGSLTFTDSLAGGAASLTVTGGAATISAITGAYDGVYATVGQGASVTAGGGNVTLAGGNSFTGGAGQTLLTLGAGADTVSLGAGNMTVNGGQADIFMLGTGATGTLVITNWTAQDRLETAGGGVATIASATVTGGSAWLTMAGGAHIELVGISHLT